MNRFGYISESYTGHLHYLSPYESDGNCGTCDGAKCDICQKRYKVEAWDNDDESAGIFQICKTDEEAKDLLRMFVAGDV